MNALDLASLEGVLRLARKYGATRISVGGLTVDLSPGEVPGSDLTPPPPPPVSEELPGASVVADPFDDGLCACGHARLTEHSPAGCLMGGCSPELCATTR